MRRPTWDFDYLPVSRAGAPATRECDLVVGTRDETRPEHISEALLSLMPRVQVEALLVRHPLFWYRIRVEEPLGPDDARVALNARGIEVRFVTSAVRSTQVLGAPVHFAGSPRARGEKWTARPRRTWRENASRGRWFMDEQAGVAVDRQVCGSGAGTRLAVIDDAAGDADALELDDEVLLGISEAPRGSSHGATMVAWAVGSRGRAEAGIDPFEGVAPDASPRLYVMPTPGKEEFWLPLAIVRAVDDGADVVVCATNIEGMTTPLLDDALEFATKLGRNGLGTPVVVPAGREFSSPNGSVHASLTLGLADPASDPRILCVAPSGRRGGWFLWSDRFGKLRPFANRGPAIRFAAPGDDMAYPFVRHHRVGHAESSGASAIAAGVLLLVLGTNPDIQLDALVDLIVRTASPCRSGTEEWADPADGLPAGRDADGHDAKCGYGKVSALRACLSARDPFASVLVAMGEDDAARHYVRLRAEGGSVAQAYSEILARWASQVLATDPIASHAMRSLLRHLRLIAGHPTRHFAQVPGAMLRVMVLILRRAAQPVPAGIAVELDQLLALSFRTLGSEQSTKTFENELLSFASRVWGPSLTEVDARESLTPERHRVGELADYA